MTVCTYQLALRDLIEDRALAVTLHEVADIGELRRPRKMIPGHRGVMKDLAAIGTRS